MPDHLHDTAAPSGPTATSPPASLEEAPGGSDEPIVEPAGGMVPRAELEKVIRERQAAKCRARTAEQQLAALGALPQTVEDDDAPAPDALRRKLQERESQLASLLRDDQLRLAATRAGAINPDQVVGILRSRVVVAEQTDGGLAPVILDAGGKVELTAEGSPMDVDTFVGRFLSDPSQANLLRSSSAPGSGARPAGRPAGESTPPQTLAEFNALPPGRRRHAAMRMSQKQREAMLGIARPGRDGYL